MIGYQVCEKRDITIRREKKTTSLTLRMSDAEKEIIKLATDTLCVPLACFMRDTAIERALNVIPRCDICGEPASVIYAGRPYCRLCRGNNKRNNHEQERT